MKSFLAVKCLSRGTDAEVSQVAQDSCLVTVSEGRFWGGGWTSELILSTSHDRLCKHVIWFCVYLVIGKKWHHHQQRQRHETLTDFSCNETLWKKCMRTDSKSGNGEIDENTWQDVLMKWIEMCTVAALISRWGESARETLTIFYLSYPVDLNFSDKDKNKMTLITVSIPLPCEVLPEML